MFGAGPDGGGSDDARSGFYDIINP